MRGSSHPRRGRAREEDLSDLLPIPVPTSSSGVAPSFCGARAWCVGPENQLETVVIYRSPVMTVDSEVVPLLVVGRVDHDRSPRLGHVDHSRPDAIPYSCGCLADEHPWGYLHQPTGEMPPEPHGARRDHDDRHSSYATPPGTWRPFSSHNMTRLSMSSGPYSRTSSSGVNSLWMSRTHRSRNFPSFMTSRTARRVSPAMSIESRCATSKATGIVMVAL